MITMLKRLLFADFPVLDDPQACRFYPVEIDLERCDGCKLCTMVCPAATLELAGEKGAKKVRLIADGYGCISCNNCYAICKQQAIKARRHYKMTGFYNTEGLGKFSPPRKSFKAEPFCEA